MIVVKILRQIVPAQYSCGRVVSNFSPFESSYKDEHTQLGRTNRRRQQTYESSSERRNYYEFEKRERNVFTAGQNLDNIDWKRVALTENVKLSNKIADSAANRAGLEVEKFYTSHNISVDSSFVPTPVLEFDEMHLPVECTNYLKSKYQTPTPIQSVCWPAAVENRDIIGIGATGSGKTISFLLPGLVHAAEQPRLVADDGPLLLIVCPTRELVRQVHDVAMEFSPFFNFSTALLYGGASRGSQISQFYRRSPEVCIACPGRLLDLLESGALNLKRCTYVVMDEADRMLDMGFEPQLRRIFDQIRPDHQTLMFSATWPAEIRALASEFLHKPVHVTVGSQELAANSNIHQHILCMSRNAKLSTLMELFKREVGNAKTLIFANTKSNVDMLSQRLYNEGLKPLAIHGDKTQNQRDFAINSFRNGVRNILVATDVAGRGIDVRDIKFVINYDFPMEIEAYVHRIGRTGRVNDEGHAYSFFTDFDVKRGPALLEVLEKSDQTLTNELRNFIDAHTHLPERRRPKTRRNYRRSNDDDFDEHHEKSRDSRFRNQNVHQGRYY